MTVKLCVHPQSNALKLLVSFLKLKADSIEETSLELPGNVVINSPMAIARYLAKEHPSTNLYPADAKERTQVDHWMEFATYKLKENSSDLKSSIEHLDKCLATSTFLVGKSLTLADVFVVAALKGSECLKKLISEKSAGQHLCRYYDFLCHQDFITNLDGEWQVVVGDSDEAQVKNQSAQNGVKKERKKEGKFIELPGAKMGEVVVRFPPEASGYLHIGHAKAALLNQYYQQAFEGVLILRFDDTNPEKESAEFEKVILEDVKLLGIVPDKHTRTSDHFGRILDLCTKMIKEGRAYADDTDPEVMKKEREERVESKNRNNSVEKNLSMWKEMQEGTEYGLKCCIRAKINMASDNGCLRDPTMYRCKLEEHVSTGTKYKVYPTYDFACPIVDSLEGVTHTLRTMEYHDRDDQFHWFIDALGLRKPIIWEYSRLNLMNTVMSKRKLTWLVNEGIVEGWDDPRFPTVRGVLRRGMTVEGMKEFVVAQGSSRATTTMEWDKIWAFNKKVIDPIAPRYVALEKSSMVPVYVEGAVKESKEVQKHPKDSNIGMKTVYYNSKVFIEGADAKELHDNETVTFINWGNLVVKKIVKDGDSKVVSVNAVLALDNKDFKNTQKLTWLAEDAPTVPAVCCMFDHIISKPVLGKEDDFKKFVNKNSKVNIDMLGDPELANLKKGEIIQLQKRGFFICDSPYEPTSRHSGRAGPCILFSVPDGHTKEMPTSGSKMKSKEEKKNSSAGSAAPVGNKKTSNAAPASAEKVKPAAGLKVPSAADLNKAITEQGDIIRELKAAKAPKDQIDLNVKKLLELKKQFEEATGVSWKPGVAVPAAAAPSAVASAPSAVAAAPAAATAPQGDAEHLNSAIIGQGNIVRDLKSAKAPKDQIDVNVKKLQELKKQFEVASGVSWKPGVAVPAAASAVKAAPVATAAAAPVISAAPSSATQKEPAELNQNILELQGQIDEWMTKLQGLKDNFEKATGVSWKKGVALPAIPVVAAAQPATPVAADSAKGNKKKKPNEQPKSRPNEAKPKAAPVQAAAAAGDDQSASREVKKISRLGLEAKKNEDFSEWYSQVIIKAEMIEYYDVSGCYILRPWSFNIWKKITSWFDDEIEKIGFQDCYFPMFVSKSALETEKDHIADFAPEVAWVTKSGDTDLAESIAIRPTSETVMYPYYAKWVQSYRDLPIRLNQWCNVVRWEFKHPQPFLRTREFLWQEGHSAHNNYKDAEEEVYQILELYSQVYQDLLAVPVIKGRKTEKEKFPGGDFTTTIEAFISATGRGIQAATSHHLGKNFSKMFNICFEDPVTREKEYAYQNSWGLTTRSIGVAVMVHGDDKGLVLPPRVAPSQVVIVPCGITAQLEESEKEKLTKECEVIAQKLTDLKIRVKCDVRDYYSPGWKFNHWEVKGVPIRIELGPKDLKKSQFVAVRRDTGEKLTLNLSEVTKAVPDLLEEIHKCLFDKAKKELDSNIVVCHDFEVFCTGLSKKKLLLAPFCGEVPCEDKIKELSAREASTEEGAPSMGAKGLCIPFDQPAAIKEGDRCIGPDCTHKPKMYTLFGRSY